MKATNIQNDTTNTITPNDKPAAKPQTIPMKATNIQNDTTKSTALDVHQKLMDEHIESDLTFDNTQDSRDNISSNTEHSDRDITLETFYQYPIAAELSNDVTEELKQVLPKITHNFNNKRKILDAEEEAANAALAWYHQIRTKTATEKVAKVIEEEQEAPSKTIQKLIDKSINKSLEKTSHKIAQSVKKINSKKIFRPNSRPERDGHPQIN